jgi:hypothetical protein
MKSEGIEKGAEPESLSLLSSLSVFIDENKRTISAGFYLLAGLGLLKIGRSVQVFSQFRTARDIPEEFVAKKLNVFGTVRNAKLVSMNRDGLTPVLWLEHIPLARLPWTPAPSPLLQIALAAVVVPTEGHLREVTEQTLIRDCCGQKVKVQLLMRLEGEDSAENVLYGRVRLKQLGLWRGCVASRLVAEGLAAVAACPDNVGQVDSRYVTALEKSQLKAKKKGKGLWERKGQKGPYNLWTKPKSWLLSKFIS